MCFLSSVSSDSYAQVISPENTAGCVEPIAQSTSDAFSFLPSESYTAFAATLGPENVIGTITFTRFNVFNMDDKKESNPLFRLANNIHFVSRESVIREQLLVMEGGAYNTTHLAESERLLRNLDFIYDARVRAWRVCGGIVDIEVITRDTWTLELSASASRSGGDTSYTFGVGDSNIFGLGKEVALYYDNDPDRSGVTGVYRDPAVLGSRWNLDLTLSDNDDGYFRNLAVERPFFSIDESWSAGGYVTEGKLEEANWFRGDEVSEFNQEYQRFSVYGGRALDEEHHHKVDRLLYGFAYETNEFSFSDSDIPPAQLPQDRDYAFPFIGIESIEDEYTKVRNMNYLGRTEDVYIGERYRGTVGWSDENYGATQNQIALQGSYGNTLLSDDSRLWSVDMWLSGFWSPDQQAFENLWWSGHTSYHHRQAHNWTFFTEARIDFTDGLTDDRQVVLGGDTGLRGYERNYQVGDRSFVISLEERYYSEWHPFRLFRVGAAAFLDVGRAWYDDRDNGSNDGVLADVGIGIRLNSSRAQKSRVIHIDLAFPLVTDSDVDSVQLLFRVRERF